ncbi:MAG: lambda-exonuclease family protein [Holophagaceae bacterium]
MTHTETREKWLELRRQGITGTDVAKILGRSKWGKPIDVYRDKLGLNKPPIMNTAMLHGIEAEPRIIKMYAERNKVIVSHVGHLIHPTESWIIGNPDGIVINEKGFWTKGLEIKTGSNKRYWSSAYDKEMFMPEEYIWQCRWYMALTQLSQWDVAVLLQNEEYRQYQLFRDSILEKEMIETCKYFWFENICKRIEP